MGKKNSGKKTGPVKLLPQARVKLSDLVDKILKKCTKIPSSSAPNSAEEWDEYLQIYELIKQVQEIEKDIRLPSYNRQEQIKPFTEWLEKNGAEFNKVEIADYGDEGFGLQTVAEIHEGDVALTIPRALIMSEDTAKKSYLGSLLEKDQILQNMGNVLLALHVLVEYVDQNSPWQPYLQMLPATYDLILYFTPDLMQQLKGSPVLDTSLGQFRNICRQYAYFYTKFQAPEARSWPIKDYFTFDAYRWAVSTVMTRVNRIPGLDFTARYALVPGWDMANHEEGVISTDYNETSHEVSCFAQRHFKMGEQFKICYGQRPNSTHFFYGGFVSRGNMKDSLSVKLGVSRSDPLYNDKVKLLTSIALPASGNFMIHGGPCPISPELLAFTRVFCMDKDSLEKWRDDGKKAKNLMHDDCDVGTLVQDKTWMFLRTRVSLLERAYRSTLEEDEGRFPSLSGQEALICSFLITEKRILKDASMYLSARLQK